MKSKQVVCVTGEAMRMQLEFPKDSSRSKLNHLGPMHVVSPD